MSMTLDEFQPIPLSQTGPVDGGNFEYHWTGDFAEAHLLSDVGKKRKRNEDTCAMCAPEDAELFGKRGLLLAVADGMGGASAGDFASHLALNVILDDYYRGHSVNIPDGLRGAIEEANRVVFAESEVNPERRGMGTTVSLLVVRGDCAYIAQVGDSRVYVARRRERLFQITSDHSLVAEQVRNGYLSQEEARNHSLKNLITRAVGIKANVKVDLFALRLKPHDTLLLCSDGLSNQLKDEEIVEHMMSDNLKAAGRRLVGRALTAGGSDNITAVLLRLDETPRPIPFEPGVEEVFIPPSGLFRKFWRFMKS
jgi:protein phosphatase